MNINKTLNISILLIGNELLDGRLQDSNANFLAFELKNKTSHLLKNIVTVRDDEQEIIKGLRFLESQSECVICSGGLGPTTDDLTREALAKYFEVDLVLDQDVLDKLKERYHKRGRDFDPSNIKQAKFPKSAKIIPNAYGTAAAFSCKKDNFSVTCLPGVPSELKGIWVELVLPELLKIGEGFKPREVYTFRIFGIPESTLNSKVESLGLSSNTLVTYRAHFPEIELQLSSEHAESLKNDCLLLESLLGEQSIFSRAVELSLEKACFQILKNKKLTIACAESCTGGGLGSVFVKNPGASEVFYGSLVAYNNQQKQSILGISPDLINTHSAVSIECVESMAQNVRKIMSADLGLAITGYAGDFTSATDIQQQHTKSEPQEEVGLFYVALATKTAVFSQKFFYKDERQRFLAYATYAALNFMRFKLISEKI